MMSDMANEGKEKKEGTPKRVWVEAEDDSFFKFGKEQREDGCRGVDDVSYRPVRECSEEVKHEAAALRERIRKAGLLP